MMQKLQGDLEGLNIIMGKKIELCNDYERSINNAEGAYKKVINFN